MLLVILVPFLMFCSYTSQTSHTELFIVWWAISHPDCLDLFLSWNYLYGLFGLMWGFGWGRVAASAGRRRQSLEPLSPAPPMESQDVPRPANRYNVSSVPSVCPAVSSWMDVHIHPCRQASRWHPDQMPKVFLHWASLWCLNTTHFDHLIYDLESHDLSHYPKLMTIDWLVNREPHLPA